MSISASPKRISLLSDNFIDTKPLIILPIVKPIKNNPPYPAAIFGSTFLLNTK